MRAHRRAGTDVARAAVGSAKGGTRPRGATEDIGEAALDRAAGASWMTGHTMVVHGGQLVAFDPGDV